MQLPFELPQFVAGPLSDARVQALGILLVSLAAARLTDRLFCGLVARFARRSATALDDRIVDYLHWPVFYTVLVVGANLSLEALLHGNAPHWVRNALLTGTSSSSFGTSTSPGGWLRPESSASRSVLPRRTAWPTCSPASSS